MSKVKTTALDRVGLFCSSCGEPTNSTIGGKCAACHNPNQAKARLAFAAFKKRFSDNYDAGKGIKLSHLEMSFILPFVENYE